MKNIIIVVLVIALGIMGYFVFAADISTNSNQTTPTPTNATQSPTAAETTQSAAPTASSGKTIDLSNKSLTEVPKNILDDNSVTTFNVSDNKLTGSLPGEIRKLTNLEVLLASDNTLTGVPAEIGQLSKLKIVNFANNNLSGLPQELGKLQNLQTLDLRGNPNISQNDIGIIQKQIPNASILTD